MSHDKDVDSKPDALIWFRASWSSSGSRRRRWWTTPEASWETWSGAGQCPRGREALLERRQGGLVIPRRAARVRPVRTRAVPLEAAAEAFLSFDGSVLSLSSPAVSSTSSFTVVSSGSLL